MIAAARSRNIRFNIVVQSEKQLRSRYIEEADTIKGNCNNWIYLYSREYPTLVEISNLCGTQKSGKSLVTTSRLQRLDKNKGEVLIMHGRKYPFISYLKDINEYDDEKFEKPYHEKGSYNETIKLFDIIAYLNAVGWEYAQDRLRRNESNAPTTTTEYIPKICVNDLFQKQADYNTIFEASSSWYKRHIRSFRSIKNDGIEFEITESPSNTLYSRSPISYVALPDVVEMVNENIAVISNNQKDLFSLSKELFVQLLTRKKVIPIYYDLHSFAIPKELDCVKFSDWTTDKKKEKAELLLLPLLIARQLFCESFKFADLEQDCVLMDSYKTIIANFENESNSKNEYVVILYGLDDAPFLAESIYQCWALGAFKNVRIVVFCSNEGEVLDRNCADFCNINDEKRKMYSKCILYFDEKTNRVAMKQQPSPEYRIRLNRKK